MTRRRWIADRVAGDRAYLSGANAVHLAKVLRARPGQQFDIAAAGQVRTGAIVSISSDEVEFALGDAVVGEPSPEISAMLAVFKFDRLEWAIEKLTELGIAKIIPVVSRRTEQHLAKAAEKRVERWRKIVHEAAQQARRSEPPEVTSPVALKKAIQEAGGCRIVLSEAEDATSLKSAITQCSPPVTLAFGPEGGWTADELDLFRASGWTAASLGSTILRSETAAIAAVAIALSELQSKSTTETRRHGEKLS